MATQRVHPDSPIAVKLRNFESVAETLITQVTQAAHSTITHAQARTNVTTALATVVDDGQHAPFEWETFTGAVTHILNASEAAPSKAERLKLLSVARLYLDGLLDTIVEEEQVRHGNRGYFVTFSQALDYKYLIAVMDQAMANNTVLNFEP